jgi:hypothetical protein
MRKLIVMLVEAKEADSPEVTMWQVEAAHWQTKENIALWLKSFPGDDFIELK